MKEKKLFLFVILLNIVILINLATLFAGEEFQVNTYTEGGQGYPSVAMDSDGDFVITWFSVTRYDSHQAVYVQLFDKNCNPVGSEFTVNINMSDNQKVPSVAINSNGDFAIVWEEVPHPYSEYSNICARLYNKDGNPVGSEIMVSLSDGYSLNFRSIAMDSDGDFVITWQARNQGGSDNDIYARRFDKDGNPAGSEFMVNTNTRLKQSAPSIAMDSDGDFVIAWDSNYQVGTVMGIVARQYDKDGNPAGSEFMVSTLTEYNQQKPSVAMDADGNFVIAWQSLDQDGDGWGIYARLYDSDGNSTGSQFKVNLNTINDQEHPSATMDPDGNFVIAWQSEDQDGSSTGVYAQEYDKYGNPFGSEYRVNTYIVSDQRLPSAAMNSGGKVVLAWQSKDQDGDGSGIYAKYYKSPIKQETPVPSPTPTVTRTPYASEQFQVNTFALIDQDHSSVAMDSDGDFVITWVSKDQDWDDWGIFAQRYGKDGYPAGSEFQVNTKTKGSQSSPSVAMDSDGNFIIAWSSYNQESRSYEVHAQRYDKVGNPEGSEFRIISNLSKSQGNPLVMMNSDGDFIIIWDGGYGMYAQRFDKDGNPAGSEFQVDKHTSSGIMFPSAAMNSDGDFVVTWTGHNWDQNGSSYEVHAQRFDKDNNPAGSEIWINPSSENEFLWDSSAAMDSDGDFVITWQSSDTNIYCHGIIAQLFDRDGNPVGSEFRVNTHRTGEKKSSSAAMDSEGNFIITWQSTEQDGSGSGIYAQRYDKSGNTVGSEFRLNTTTKYDQISPSAAMNSVGGFVISWTNVGGGIFNSAKKDIYARYFKSFSTIPTYTTTPTLTQTATITPYPTITFTPTQEQPVHFNLSCNPDKSTFNDGDNIRILMSATTKTAVTVDVYFVMLDPSSFLYFAPYWQTTKAQLMKNCNIPANLSLDNIQLLELSLPNLKPLVSDPGTYTFAVGATKPGTINFVSNISTVSFKVK